MFGAVYGASASNARPKAEDASAVRNKIGGQRSGKTDASARVFAHRAAGISCEYICEEFPASAMADDRAKWRHFPRSEEHTSELQSQSKLVCRLLLEKKKN